jgi:hypothetical protein
MSAEAMGYVYRHSPYKGAALMVHLSIADSVNDQNGNKFWMSLGKLAAKCRSTRQTTSAMVDQLCADGWLIELKREPGRTVLYQFVYVDAAVVYESRWGVVSDDRGVSPEVTGGVVSADINPIEPKCEPKSSSSTDVDGEFDLFWSKYPRPVGRKAARASFVKALKDATADQIMQALAFYRLEWFGKEERFIPHPATWLNQGRYLDKDFDSSISAEDMTTESSQTAQEASTALLDGVWAYHEGKAWRGAEKAVYENYRNGQPEELWVHLDRGFNEG